MKSLFSTVKSANRSARFAFRVSRLHSRRAWRWYYGAFLSPEITARYQEAGKILGIALCIMYEVARFALEQVDQYIQSCQQSPEEAAPLPETAPATFEDVPPVSPQPKTYDRNDCTPPAAQAAGKGRTRSTSAGKTRSRKSSGKATPKKLASTTP